MQYTIRQTREDDIHTLIAIEQVCNTMFDAFGYSFAPDDVMSADTHRIHVQDGRSWVVVYEADQPVGFAVACTVEGEGHLEEVSVHPDHGRRGLGRMLIESVCAWASARGYAALTLTTERDVPWNAPYYARLGFEVVPPERWTEAQRHIFEKEAELANPQSRVLMRRKLTSGTEPA